MDPARCGVYCVLHPNTNDLYIRKHSDDFLIIPLVDSPSILELLVHGLSETPYFLSSYRRHGQATERHLMVLHIAS